ncbi:50S ribosomal protein L11 methyltransferase [Argonema galeatum]|uniref:50S ribosomal protein L11 methyltransferase n=1 Tax=Argonema galeatum TaxID=2942762 RepID=UPI002012B5A7|nr:50S ribosomal protein L11 methyltransferase [Argonema galeatum]MCL1465755.1 50S ribosomal protein L11 methyltransferase [Argonema galeatum A003/A1]
MYSILGYGSMIADKGRMDAYVKALRQAVKPDSVVVDIGTGTGIFALLACQFGAKKVYAIEPSDTIQVAREIAYVNGYADRIQLIQKLSSQVELPELADVVISDIRGVLPLFKQHIPSIVDARKRLLAPGGIMIPQRDTLWAAVVEVPHLYNRIVSAWDDSEYGFDMKAARQIVTNIWSKGWVAPAQLLTTPQSWAILDYTTIESPDISAEINWDVARSGTAHGLSVWFDATLAEGISFSNAPGMPELIYSIAFFPWTEAVLLRVGDKVSVTLQANLVGEDYVWRWNTCVLEGDNPEKVKAKFQQSTFFGIPLSPAQLRKTAANYVPTLNEDGEIDRLIVEFMSSGMALGDIANRVKDKFPSRFRNSQEALTRIGDISKKYSK